MAATPVPMHEEVVATAIAYQPTTRFNATRNTSQTTLADAGEQISMGLARRLAHHARVRLVNAGFALAIDGCELHIETVCDAPSPADRSYTVSFVNHRGGRIGVEGILTKRGWPVLDHGFFIDGEGVF